MQRDELKNIEEAGKLLVALICIMIVELDHSYPFNPAWIMHLDDPHLTEKHEYDHTIASCK